MKKIYSNPKLTVIDLKNDICGIISGSNQSGDDPVLTAGGGSEENDIVGGDARSTNLWDKEW